MKGGAEMSKTRIRDLVLCSMFAALSAIGAFIKIPIPMVPFTMQLAFTTLAGYILGGKNGMISVAIYIALGLMGLPLFTEGGGIGYIFKPTFGYLIGFAFGAYITGKIANKSARPSYLRLLAAGFAGLLVVYVLGIVYFYIINRFYLGTDIKIADLLIYCFLLSIPGDIILTFISAMAAKRLIPLMANMNTKSKGSYRENE